jgi:tetratricopeptide (TPR) repeat protein
MKGYSELADSEKTLYYYEKAKCANVGEGIINNILGTAYFNAGKFYQALEMFESIIAKDHDNIDILINKSAALVELGFAYLAQSILEKIIKQKPNYEGAMTNLALAYHKQNKFDLATIYGEQAYHLNDHDYINLNNLGLFYSAIGDYEKAIDCFNLTLTIKKDFAPALHNKADKLALSGKTEEALQCIEELLKYDPIYLGAKSIQVTSCKILSVQLT